MKNRTLSHKERIQAVLSGQKPDRIPVALWRHFPVDDQDPENLALATLNFQKIYQLDLVKVTPASSFCLKDWGAEDVWEGNPDGTRRYTRHVIQSPQDWEDLPVLPPTSFFLAQQLDCLTRIRKNLDPSTPLIQTIFDPLSQAKNLAGGDRLIFHLRKYPEAVLKGLHTIKTTTIRFLEQVIKIGVDGIFLAVQHAQAHLLTEDEFQTFGMALDFQLLEVVDSLWCNILHLHGTNVYFNLVKDYPLHVINWHDHDTPPSIRQASTDFKGVLCAGLKRETMSLGTPVKIIHEVEEAVSQVKGRKLILGTGCVMPVITPHGNICTVKNWVENNES